MKTSHQTSAAPLILFWAVPSISELKQFDQKCATLINAIVNKLSVKVITSNQEKLKLDQLSIDDGLFYGFMKRRGKNVKLTLNVNKIIAVSYTHLTLPTTSRV